MDWNILQPKTHTRNLESFRSPCLLGRRVHVALLRTSATRGIPQMPISCENGMNKFHDIIPNTSRFHKITSDLFRLFAVVCRVPWAALLHISDISSLLQKTQLLMAWRQNRLSQLQKKWHCCGWHVPVTKAVYNRVQPSRLSQPRIPWCCKILQHLCHPTIGVSSFRFQTQSLKRSHAVGVSEMSCLICDP